MKPLISVIVPCYNQESFLNETLDSIYNQTFQIWECIIIDDGSTDNSKEIALKWCALDERFKYFFQLNGGLSNARNKGLHIAKGDYIQLLDGDDLIIPKKFESQLIDLKNAQISISNYFSFVNGNFKEMAKHRYLSPFVSEENYKKEIIVDWEYRISIPCHTVLFQKSLIEVNKISFDETLPNHEDWVFWAQLFYFSIKIKNNDNVFALYRISENSMSMNYPMMKEGFIEASKVLLNFYKKNNERELMKLIKIKQNEIINKNRKPLLKRLKSKIKSKITVIYNYVKSN